MFDLGKLCRLCANPVSNAFDCTQRQNRPLLDAIKKLYNVEIKETDTAKLICGNCEGLVFADLMRYENVQDVQKKISNFAKMLSQVEVVKLGPGEVPCVDLASSSEASCADSSSRPTNPIENEPSTSRHVAQLSSTNQPSTLNAAIQIQPSEARTKTPVPAAVASTSGLNNQKPSRKQSSKSTKSCESRAITFADAIHCKSHTATSSRLCNPTSSKRPIDNTDKSPNKQGSKRQKLDESAAAALTTPPSSPIRVRTRNQLPQAQKQTITNFFQADKTCKTCSTTVHSRSEYKFHSNVHQKLQCPVCYKRFKGDTHLIMAGDHVKTCLRIQEQAPNRNLKKLFRGKWKVIVKNMSLDEMHEAMQSKCDASKVPDQEAPPKAKCDNTNSERRDKKKKSHRTDAHSKGKEKTAGNQRAPRKHKKNKKNKRPGKTYGSGKEKKIVEIVPKILDVNWNEASAKDKIASLQEYDHVPFVHIRITEQTRDKREVVSANLASFSEKIQFFKTRGEMLHLKQQQQQRQVALAALPQKQSMLRARAKSMYRPSDERKTVQMRSPPRRPSDPQLLPKPTIPQYSITAGTTMSHLQSHVDHTYTSSLIPPIVTQRPYTNPQARPTIMTAIGEPARTFAQMSYASVESQVSLSMPAVPQNPIISPPAKQTVRVNNVGDTQTRNLKVLSVDILNSRVVANNAARDVCETVVSATAQEAATPAASFLTVPATTRIIQVPSAVLASIRSATTSMQQHAPVAVQLSTAPQPNIRTTSQVQALPLARTAVEERMAAVEERVAAHIRPPTAAQVRPPTAAQVRPPTAAQVRPPTAAVSNRMLPISPRAFGPSTSHPRRKITPMRPRPPEDDVDESISVSLSRLQSGAVELSLRSEQKPVQYDQLSEMRKERQPPSFGFYRPQ